MAHHIPEVPMKFERRFIGRIEKVSRKKYVRQFDEETRRRTWVEVPPEEDEGEFFVEISIANLSWQVPWGAYIRRYQYTGDPRQQIGWRRFVRALRDAGVEATSISDLEGMILWFRIDERTLPSGATWEDYLPDSVPSEEEINRALERRAEPEVEEEILPEEEGWEEEQLLTFLKEKSGTLTPRTIIPAITDDPILGADPDFQTKVKDILKRLLDQGRIELVDGKYIVKE